MNFQTKWTGRILFVLTCLVTLFVLFHVEENWRGERNWSAYKQQMEVKGAKFGLAAFAPPRVPDGQNFAMTPFLSPLFDFEPGTQKHRDTNAVKRTQAFAASLPSGPSRGSWATGTRADLAQWQIALQKKGAASAKQPASDDDRIKAAAAVLEKLNECNVVLDELRAASRRPYSRFNLSYDAENPVAITLPHLQVIRRASCVLQLRTLSELALNRTDAAFDDAVLMFHLANSMKDEPMLISHLVRVSCVKLVAQVLWEGLANHRWSEAQLQAFQARLGSFDFLASYTQALETERAGLGNGTFEFLLKSGNRGALFGIMEENALAGSVILGMLPRGWIRMEQLSYNRIFDDLFFQTFDAASERVYPTVVARNSEAFGKSVSSPWRAFFQHRVLAGLLCPALNQCLMGFSNAQTVVQEAMLACALERCRLADGRFPDSLDALPPRFVGKLPHDIITSGPLKYRRVGDGYVLYSVGWNEKDDGGVPGEKNDQGDWVWQCPAKK